MEIRYRRNLNKLLMEHSLPMIAVEVGVAEGRFSLEMLRDWQLEKLYLVDLWEHTPGMRGDLKRPHEYHVRMYNQCMSNIQSYLDKCTILKGWSTEMANRVPDNTLGLCYIDASHEKKWVKRDLDSWYPKLVDGGIMAGHDYLNRFYGVKQAVDEFASSRNLSVNTIPEQNKDDAGFWFTKERR